MGTWSRPLFVSVTPGNPEDYYIDTTKIDSLHRWKNNGFFPDSNITSYNLTQFMNTGCNTHKILDHMNNKQINDWLTLFQHIISNNPTLETTEFHFFCIDSQEPYYIRLNRQNISSIYLNLFIGTRDNIHYFLLEDENTAVFSETLYKQKWNKTNFRIVINRLDIFYLW